MIVLKDAEWKIQVLPTADKKEYFWFAEIKDGGVNHGLGDSFKRKYECKANWETFAALNGITNWTYDE